MMRLTKLRIIVLAIFVLIALLGIISAHQSGQKGTLDLRLALPDTNNLTVRLNQESIPVANLLSTHTLKTGSYTLTISKPGYRDSNSAFTIRTNKITLVHVVPQRSVDTTITSWEQIKSNTTYTSGIAITGVTYFYDKTWAFLSITTYGDDAASVVAHYDDSTKAWKIVLGPGTSFDPGSVQSLPPDVSAFMSQSNVVDNSGGIQ